MLEYCSTVRHYHTQKHWEVRANLHQGVSRKGRGCVDYFLLLKMLFEKYLEKHRKLFAAFKDLEMVYDKVDRKGLWDVTPLTLPFHMPSLCPWMQQTASYSSLGTFQIASEKKLPAVAAVECLAVSFWHSLAAEVIPRVAVITGNHGTGLIVWQTAFT